MTSSASRNSSYVLRSRIDWSRKQSGGRTPGGIDPFFSGVHCVGVERQYDGSLLKMLLMAYKPSVFRESVNVSGQVESVVRTVAGFDAAEVL